MAHAAKIVGLADQLIASVSKDSALNASLSQQLRENTIKQLRIPGHARTDQFDVQSKLDGLVEKFDVLNRGDLAERLQTLLDDLPVDSKWLPETLSLLLLLSDRPVEKTRIKDVDAAIEKSVERSPDLTWAELVAEDPLDQQDIWSDVDRGNYSSEDDVTVDEEDVSADTISTQATSVHEFDLAAQARSYLLPIDPGRLHKIEDLRCSLNIDNGENLVVSELFLIRETFAMLHGLPTDLYRLQSSTSVVTPKYSLTLATASRPVIRRIVMSFAELGSSLECLRHWACSEQQAIYLQSCQQVVQSQLMQLSRQLAALEKRFISPPLSFPVSIAEVHTSVERCTKSLHHISRMLPSSTDQRSAEFTLLDLFYQETCNAQMSGDLELCQALSAILLSGIKTYLRPAAAWIQEGRLGPTDHNFFVTEVNRECDPGDFWHEKYAIRAVATGRNLAPVLMQGHAQRIFALGKSRALSQALGHVTITPTDPSDSGPDFGRLQDQLSAELLLPFSQVLDEAIDIWITTTGQDCTLALCNRLLYDFNLIKTFRGLGQAFCSRDGVLFQTFAETLFWRMYKAKSSWKDRFLLTELVQNANGSNENVDSKNLSITLTANDESQPTTITRQIQSIKLETIFTWPIQNITRCRSPASYSKVFILLLQVQHARYNLRQQLFDLRPPSSKATPPILSNVRPSAIRLRAHLLAVVDTLHFHVTSTAHDLNDSLCRTASDAKSIDALVEIWRNHIKAFESSLLLAENLKPLRASVDDLLELCERFATLWTRTALRKSTSKSEEGHRGRTEEEEEGVDNGNDETEREEGEESFDRAGASWKNDERPLADQLPSPPSLQEVAALHDELDKSRSFLIAGLRGVSRATGNSSLERFADRLEWSTGR